MYEVIANSYVHTADSKEDDAARVLLIYSHVMYMIVGYKVTSGLRPGQCGRLPVLEVRVPLGRARHVSRRRIVPGKPLLIAAQADPIGTRARNLITRDRVVVVGVLQADGVAAHRIEQIVGNLAVLGVLHIHGLRRIRSLVIGLLVWEPREGLCERQSPDVDVTQRMLDAAGHPDQRISGRRGHTIRVEIAVRRFEVHGACLVVQAPLSWLGQVLEHVLNVETIALEQASGLAE